MTFSRAFSNLVLILIINLFIQMHTADAGSVGCERVKVQVKNVLSTVCNTSDSELICDKAIGLFLTKIQKECSDISEKFCSSSVDHIVEQRTKQLLNLTEYTILDKFIDSYSQVFRGNCLKTKPAVCSVFDSVNLKEKCAKNLAYLGKFFPDARSGNETRLCYVLPTTIRGVCNLAVRQGCEAIKIEEPSLEELIPECEQDLSKLVCDDVFETIQVIIDEERVPGVIPLKLQTPEDQVDCSYKNMERV